MNETGLSLPSAEYKVTFADDTVTMLSVHPDESLEESLEEMLQSAGRGAEEVSSIELSRTFDLEKQHTELLG